AWGELKSGYGWSHERILAGPAGALILYRQLPMGLTLAYVPKGPVGSWLPTLLPALDDACRARGAFALKLEPDESDPLFDSARMPSEGFRPGSHSIQPRRTLIVDLSPDEDDILAGMHQKTRYNIRLAGRKGVSVRPWTDLAAFGAMMNRTGERNEFGVHLPAYYRQAYTLFHPEDQCEILVAEHDGQPLAAVMVFARGRRAWYFYGASLDIERQRMPTYLLQWEAMRWAKAKGCLEYDLWGVPDEDEESLEAQFTHRSDGLWGVYRFKRGFGGRLRRTPGAWDRVYRPLPYMIYRLVAQRRIQG
ncbi:MAG: peptidoglycan bridge formation glycyltransferase FemA/FemB family protein, partial [Anaerolineales bacterium]